MSSRSVEFAQRYGPWAIVTGASEGIGRAFACRLAADGLNLVLVARRAVLLDALAAELRTRNGIQCRTMSLDLSQLAAVQQMAAETADLDVGLLVASAGFGTFGGLQSGHLLAEPGKASARLPSDPG